MGEIENLTRRDEVRFYSNFMASENKIRFYHLIINLVNICQKS